jgi:hypothetical protein
MYYYAELIKIINYIENASIIFMYDDGGNL